MKKFINSLVALAIAVAIVMPLLPAPCCDEHAGTDESCPPPISTFNILPTADN